MLCPKKRNLVTYSCKQAVPLISISFITFNSKKTLKNPFYTTLSSTKWQTTFCLRRAVVQGEAFISHAGEGGDQNRAKRWVNIKFSPFCCRKMLQKGPSGHYVRRPFLTMNALRLFSVYYNIHQLLNTGLLSFSWHFNAEMLHNIPLRYNITVTVKSHKNSKDWFQGYFQCSINLLWCKHLTATLAITNKPFNCSKLSQIEHSCLYLRPGDGPFKFPHALCSSLVEFSF